MKMKNLFWIVVLLLITLCQTATAQTISIGSEECFVGDTVTIPVNVSVNDAIGLSFTLNFDPNIVQITNVTLNQSIAEFNFINVDNTNGSLKIALIFEPPFTGEGDMVFLEFKAVKSGTSYLNFTEAEYSDENFTPYSLSTSNGSIVVKEFEGLTISPDSLEVTLAPGKSYTETKTVEVGRGHAYFVTLQVLGDEEWISFEPPEYWNVSGPTTLEFNVTITVPEGTPAGNYSFKIK